MKSQAKLFPEPQIDLKNFRLKRINEPQYRHIWFLLFWPIFGLRYLLIENLNPAGEYHLIHCPLDDMIPFQELFPIPYGDDPAVPVSEYARDNSQCDDCDLRCCAAFSGEVPSLSHFAAAQQGKLRIPMMKRITY